MSKEPVFNNHCLLGNRHNFCKGIFSVVFGAVGFCFFAISSAQAKAPVVVELFTSQSCYSCPPAEQYLAELAGRKDLVTLEWHVDYWDNLVYGNKGKWKDPFSSYEYTKRQRRYNQNIRETGGAYTPQAIVQGVFETVGSERQEVRGFIKKAKPIRTGLSISPRSKADEELGGGLEVRLGQADVVQKQIDVWLVRYIDTQSTEVRRGENAGKVLASRHVVRMVEKLGTWQGVPTRFTIDRPPVGDGCAVLVQLPGQGRILAASYCQ